MAEQLAPADQADVALTSSSPPPDKDFSSPPHSPLTSLSSARTTPQPEQLSSKDYQLTKGEVHPPATERTAQSDPNAKPESEASPPLNPEASEEQDPGMSGFDPRALLNPKGKGAVKRQRTASPSADNKRPRVEQAIFDPRVLLNPKAATGAQLADQTNAPKPGTSTQTNAPNPEPHVPSHTNAPKPGQDVVDLGMGSMIERMHGIQRREDQPKPKSTAKPELDQGHKQAQKNQFNGASGGTVLSEYVTEKRKEGVRDTGPVVDLTGDENEDDDVVVTGAGPALAENRRLFGIHDEANKTVCLGKLEAAFANYTIVPTPSRGFAGSSTSWPPMKVRLQRRSGQHNFVFVVIDPSDRAFGQLDIKPAMALAPLIDAPNINLKLDSRIDARRKKDGEVAGGAASSRLPLNITLFAPRKSAKQIGAHLSQHQVWLRDPTARYPTSYPYENPQAIVVPKHRTLPSSSSSSTYTMTRTQDEIRSDVLNMFDSLAKTDDIPEMEPDEETIITPLLPHQKQALEFMTKRESADNDIGLWKLGSNNAKWYNIITGQETNQKPGPVQGGILADMMGLGKTLEVLSLIAATQNQARAFGTMAPPQVAIDSNANGGSRPPVLLRCNSRATLLVCPLSTVANWQEQIIAHTKNKKLKWCVHHGPNRESVAKVLANHDIVITTYQLVSSEYNHSRPLSQINWFRIVLDEAHQIRSQSTRQSLACCALNGQRRWAVTGTPVQNRLDDLGALIKFLRVKPFDEKNGFTQYILTPFKNADTEILPKLRVLVDSITLRRQKDKINLPPRHDLIVRLDFSSDERQLFDLFAKDTFRKMQAMTAGRDALAKNDMGHVLKAISRLRLICAHGAELLSDEDMKIAEGMTYSGAIEIDDDDDDEDSSRKHALNAKQAYSMLNLMKESEVDICARCDKQLGGAPASAENSDDEADTGRRDDVIGYMTPCFHLLCSSSDCLNHYTSRLNAPSASPDPNNQKSSSIWVDYADCPFCGAWVRKSLFCLLQEELDREEAAKARLAANMSSSMAKRMARYGGPHTKVKALIEELQKNQLWSEEHPDEPPIKSVVFSGWTAYLDLISIALQNHNVKHTRLDGTMSRQKRTAALDAFKNDPSVEVILISIMAGGLGLNLTTGSKAYVMEPQYNPAAEAQAVDRVHRLGQTREVTVTRFIMKDSFEERMLELQKKKKDLADLSMNRNVKLDKHEAAKRKLEDLRSLFR
ncbi:SNF2 family N-terminal domain-containing protein [Phyllosticta citriasiana]|uniref:SNF2 family N-terminal domain-containing protein n=1 Tax=Phyllosticta citriasiana TaxID=595635 RepID=A0ABR1KWL7_9PEZI